MNAPTGAIRRLTGRPEPVEFNPDARRLYERLGYTVVGELSDYLISGHGESLLRKTSGPWSEFARRDLPPPARLR